MDERASGNDKVKSVYRLYEEYTHRLLTDKVTFIFIELPKFKKTLEELDGNVLEGMYFCFKNMSVLDNRPEVLNHKIFEKIFKVSELYNMDQNIRDKVLHKMTTERDLRNQMAYARKVAIEEGLAEGLAEGLIQGSRSKALDIAKKLLTIGMTVDEVANLVDLSADEIANI